MIHGYHVILPMCGFWLPNVHRGSCLNYVRRCEIARFGRPLKTLDRKKLNKLTQEEIRDRDAASAALSYPSVSVPDVQASTIADGFRTQAQNSNYTIWAYAIIPEHTHPVIARLAYHAGRMVNLLKNACTAEMMKVGNHPLRSNFSPGDHPPRMWSVHE